jgi:hypothetical protein
MKTNLALSRKSWVERRRKEYCIISVSGRTVARVSHMKIHGRLQRVSKRVVKEER